MTEIDLFGNSVAQGIVMDANGQYRVTRVGCVRLLKRKGFPIQNYAVHGYTVLQGLDSFESMTIEPGSWCVIQFGGNDCDLDWDAVSEHPDVFHDGRVPLPDFKNTLIRFVREARDRGLKPVLVTPLAMISYRYFQWISKGRDAAAILHYLRDDLESIGRWQEKYADAVREAAVGEGCPLLDLRAALIKRLDYPSLFCEDGIHPNENGHAVMAEILMEQCEKMKA